MTLNQFKEKYIPKKYQEAVEDFEYDPLDKYWVYLKDEYISTATGTHTIHEYTIQELKKSFKTIKKVDVS